MYTQAQPSEKSLMNYVAPPWGFKVANHVLEEPAASSSTMNLAAVGSNETMVTTYKTWTQHSELSLLHYPTYIAKLCATTKRKDTCSYCFRKCSDFLLAQ